LALDAHRLKSFSKRQMRRHRFSATEKARKMAQTFFLLDCDTHQPVAFTLGSSAQSVTQAADAVLAMGAEILTLPVDANPRPLLLADKEYHTRELFESITRGRRLDLLVPVPARKLSSTESDAVAGLSFTEHWPGYATAQRCFRFKGSEPSSAPLVELVQREGSSPEQYRFQRFTATSALEALPTLTRDYPDRWHIEEFFKFQQALGWDRAGTLNLNIRYGHMSLALITQACVMQLQKRLGEPISDWDVTHLARQFFGGLEGDVRVEDDSIVVTFYNAPNAAVLREHYEDLPQKLQREGIDPAVPWLYGFKLNFRFK
jgi:Transposase DDE domain